MKKDKGKVALDIIAIVISLSALLVTLHFQYWKGASLTIGIGQDVLINSRPRIGLICSFYNSGARAATIIKGDLMWDGKTEFALEMTSPQFETWQYVPEVVEADGKKEHRARVAKGEETNFSYFPPVVVKPREYQSVVVWFTPPGAERSLSETLFSPGEHSFELRFFDGISSTPVATKNCHLDLNKYLSSVINHDDLVAYDTAIRLMNCD